MAKDKELDIHKVIQVVESVPRNQNADYYRDEVLKALKSLK